MYLLKKRAVLLPLTFFFLVIAFLVFSNGTPIGYEYVENYLHTWNENPVENHQDIWFNISSNYLQFFNGESLEDAKQREKWLKHEFAIARYNPDFEIYSPPFDPEHTITSDNSTFWNSTLKDCITPSKCYGLKRGQERTSYYMRNSLFWDWRGNVNFDPFFVWKFAEVDIENNNVLDVVVYCNMSRLDGEYYERCSEFSNDLNYTFEIDNVTQFALLDSQTRRGHYIFTNNTPVRLRFEGNGEPMLLSKVDLANEYDQLDLYWIDFRDFFNISVDAVNEVSGYLKKVGVITSSYNNSDAATGLDTRFLGTEYRAYFSFNISSIPENASIQSIRIWTQTGTVQPNPIVQTGNWKTNFSVCGDDCIADENGLKTNDWTDGKGVRVLDWDNDEGDGACTALSNKPCSRWVTLFHNNTIYSDTTARNELETAMENDNWYSVLLYDKSDYNARDYFWWWFKVVTNPSEKVPVKLEINYSLAEINMSLLNPLNDSSFNLGARLNFSWDANASLGLDSCNITINNSLYQFNSTKIPYDMSNKSKCVGSWDASRPCNNVNDTNWNTWGQANIFSTASFLANYTIPKNAKRYPDWEVKDRGGRFNLTIPAACWENDAENLSIGVTSSRAASSYTRWTCYSNFWTPERITLRNYNFGTRIYEDKIWWSILNATNYTMVFNTEGTYNWTVRCNDTSGNSNVSETRFFNISTPIVDDTEKDEKLLLYGFLAAVGLAFFIIGRKREEFIFSFFAGIIFLYLGLSFAIIGFPDFTNQFLINSNVIILVGLSIYILTDASVKEIKK